jgi:hypothetical protein
VTCLHPWNTWHDNDYRLSAGANGAEGDLECDGDIQLADLAELLGVYGNLCE